MLLVFLFIIHGFINHLSNIKVIKITQIKNPLLKSLIIKTYKMIIFFVLIALIKANLYSPHVYPKNGPFFEGWYMRMTSDNSKETYGFLFGKVLPKTPD